MANALSLVPMEQPSQNLNRTWQVQFARFFPRPLHAPPLSPSSLLTHIRTKAPRKGAWISASIPAALQILKNGSDARSVLMVLLAGKIHEEHFVSNLYFSWPQVSCDAQCIGRGSRTVFLSYGDCTGQVHKFALRFQTAYEAEMFFHSAKEIQYNSDGVLGDRNASPSIFISEHREQSPCSNSYRVDSLPGLSQSSERLPVLGKMPQKKPIAEQKKKRRRKKKISEENFEGNLSHATEIGVTRSDFIHENSPQSEFTASNILQPRADEVSSFADNDGPYIPDLHCVINKNKPYEASGNRDLGNDLDNSFSSFPPSFTSLLTNCSTETSEDAAREPGVHERIDLNSKITNCMMDPDFHDILAKVGNALGDSLGQPKAQDIIGVNSQIATCILDPSFNDIMAKVEEVWSELSFSNHWSIKQ